MTATSLGEALVHRARDRRRRRSHLRIAQAARPLSQKNRRIAIQIHGTTCAVCEFNFDETYGKDYAHGYIQIHHIKPISEYEGEVDSETDLVPLCANCHAMAHRRRDIVTSITELRALIVKAKR